MDAMTHAIEAYVSTLNCDYTDALALHAIKMIHNDLKKSYDGDMDARDAMHNAQMPCRYGILKRSSRYCSLNGS